MFSQCPLKYKYRYILGIPTPPSHVLSFGQTIHRTLRDFHRQDLFKSQADINRLLELYKHHWLPEGYDSKEHQQRRFEEGGEVLKKYFAEHQKLLGQPIYLEKKFTLKIGPTQLIGSIDRVDKLPNGGFEIIDYKTGNSKDQKYVDKDTQLSIYGLATQEALGITPQSLALYFVEENKKLATTRSPEQLERKRKEIKEQIEGIKNSDFQPKISILCQYCPYQTLCPAYKRDII
jgi:RecB family exonuclease